MIKLLILSLTLFSLVKCVADQFCLEKAQQGDHPGVLYKLSESCEMCACDGGLRKFCAPDSACKQKKEEIYNKINKKPCFDGGNRYVHASQIQSDCNICNCRNGTWDCTDNDCLYEEAVNPVQQHNTQSSAEERCKDSHKNCKGWTSRGFCDSYSYVKQKCPKSCSVCKTDQDGKQQEHKDEERRKQVEQKMKEEEQKRKEEERKREEEEKKHEEQIKSQAGSKQATCEDKDTRCSAWIKRSTKYCTSNSYVKSNCVSSCDTCPEEEIQRDLEKKRQQEKQRQEDERRRQEEQRKQEEQKRKEEEIARDVSNKGCEDKHRHCEIWSKSTRTKYCETSDYVKFNCRKSCGMCHGQKPKPKLQEKKKMSAAEIAVKKAEEEKQRRIEEWKQRLIAEGKVKINKEPEGCSFRRGGRVYPWGSQLQGSCGLCTCRKRSGKYYFDCDDCEI